ncbi:dolichyl pyrophosphate phosphatase 1 (predicted), isoform CRA_e [Rattus norvegicus]|uniref:Dolichyl pyrophosphate phosphatase 1 (Predicted), isoform CRA_e n=1 Tax=Rattus norvegicus TaxID=10116 RepID=A6JTY7_RAT|nr:dolichyl pyrophosphate phosphatase 1 (predicted), isoform CRA_e [Rattus norvegicus]
MLERLLCRGCPVYKGPRLAPRPCALSLRQDSLPPAGPEPGLGPRSEATPAVPATIAIPEPCQCFLVWVRPRASTRPSVRPSVRRLGCWLMFFPVSTRHHKGFLWSSLPS